MMDYELYNSEGQRLSDLKPLLCADGMDNFLINIIGNTEYNMEFEVYEVNGWSKNENTNKYDVPSDIELYLTGTIKWDGCSHIWFGEKEDNKQDGYLHLCGKYHWEQHCKMMIALFELAENTIEKFDKSTGT